MLLDHQKSKQWKPEVYAYVAPCLCTIQMKYVHISKQNAIIVEPLDISRELAHKTQCWFPETLTNQWLLTISNQTNCKHHLNLQIHSRYTPDALQIHSRYTQDTRQIQLQKTWRKLPNELQYNYRKLQYNSRKLQYNSKNYNTTPENYNTTLENFQKYSRTTQEKFQKNSSTTPELPNKSGSQKELQRNSRRTPEELQKTPKEL